MMTRRSLEEQPYLVDARPTLAVVTLCVAIRGQVRLIFFWFMYIYMGVSVRVSIKIYTHIYLPFPSHHIDYFIILHTNNIINIHTTLHVHVHRQATKLPSSLNSAPRLKEALQLLAADAMTDDGENVLATEVLWTPQVNVFCLKKYMYIYVYEREYACVDGRIVILYV